MQSFMKLYQKNNWSDEKINEVLKAILVPNSEPVMRSIAGINLARNSPQRDKTFLFIHYDDLIAKPAETIDRIYAFCGWAPYAHQFDNIVNRHPENDDFYNLKGFHAIRPTLNKEPNTVVLPPDIWGFLPLADAKGGCD
jgi:sulfotransferase